LYLEGVVGGLKVFLPYASDYVKTFKGKSLDTVMWKNHLFKYFDDQPEVISQLKTVDWEVSDFHDILLNGDSSDPL
jgi:leukotriene-A4 hydrolase